VQLSIDIRIQEAVHDELVKAVREFNAAGAAAVVLDARTAEVLALVSLPDFDPNDRRSLTGNAYVNRVITSVYEMGGVFEVFTTALALEQRRLTLATLVDARRPLHFGRTTLRDDDPVSRPLPVADLFARSSVIGAARIAQTVTPLEQKAFFERLGYWVAYVWSSHRPAPPRCIRTIGMTSRGRLLDMDTESPCLRCRLPWLRRLWSTGEC
jgi:cell division protein FtsI (penicillin-binding protein 3)